MKTKHVHKFLSVVSIGLCAFGCVRVPEADQKFLKKNSLIGLPFQDAAQIIKQRGFRSQFGGSYETLEIPSPQNSPEVQRILRKFEFSKHDPKFHIGLQKLSEPRTGEQRCFTRGYDVFVGSGDRIICLGLNADETVVWSGAGWFGASL